MARSRVVNLENLQQFTAVNLLSDAGHIPGPIIIPNAIQVGFQWVLEGGRTGHNVLYGSVSGSFTPTVALCNAVMTALTSGGAWTALAALFSNVHGFNAVTMRDVRSADLPIIQSTNTGVLGTSASPALPVEVAAVITLRTALTGQQNRGRLYIPCWATNALGVGNIMSAGAVTALQNWANTITTALSASGLTFSLGHPARQQYTGTTGRVHPARVAGLVPITSTPVRDNHWDTQRRRGLK